MRYRYVEWNGSEFPTQEHLRFFDQIMEFVLTYGQQALEALERVELDEQQQRLLDELVERGLLDRAAGRWRLTARAINAMQRKALMEVFRDLKPGVRQAHQSQRIGRAGERIEGTRRYEYGDPVSEIELAETLRNALGRSGPGLPIRIREDDFELYNSQGQTSVSMVILLDMSGSMARYGRFLQAKKCAMAMYALLRQRFWMDTVDVVGFYSTAAVIPEHKLPLAVPKPVTVYDPQVRIRVPLSQADEAPQHFTNLHMGLMLARRILARRARENRQIFIITDGQPTAHLQGEYLYLVYPPEQSTTVATLQEASLAAKQGIRICTFAL
ncbi:MAG: VWA domain-containing protein, partial [Phycisphaerae bacterium]